MAVHSSTFEISSKAENDILDITQNVQEIVENSDIKDGIVCIFVAGSTGAITTIEFEPGLLKDIPDALECMMPKGITYEHHLRWQDGNGHSHVRAAVLGPSLSVPVNSGAMILGTWQQIVFLELDARPRNRKIHVQIVGE